MGFRRYRRDCKGRVDLRETRKRRTISVSEGLGSDHDTPKTGVLIPVTRRAVSAVTLLL